MTPGALENRFDPKTLEILAKTYVGACYHVVDAQMKGRAANNGITLGNL